MKAVRTKEHQCPTCKSNIDAMASVTGTDTPSVGDFSVCCHCGTILRVEIGWTLSPADEKTIPKYLLTQLREIQKFILLKNQMKQ